jgi:hypothetical protein
MRAEALSQTIWRFREDAKVHAKFGRYIKKGFSMAGTEEADRSEFAMYHDHSRTVAETRIDASQFIPPHIKFPSGGFTPDWFSFNGYHFCSAKMADALAQPPDVIQYLPITFECDEAAAHEKQYRIIRILTRQPVIDYQKSEYSSYTYTGFDTKAEFFQLGFVERYVLLEGFTPNFEIFRDAEEPIGHVFATDSLAERVLKAGCIGIQFRGLDSPSYPGGLPFTIRTARGTKTLT